MVSGNASRASGGPEQGTVPCRPCWSTSATLGSVGGSRSERPQCPWQSTALILEQGLTRHQSQPPKLGPCEWVQLLAELGFAGSTGDSSAGVQSHLNLMPWHCRWQPHKGLLSQSIGAPICDRSFSSTARSKQHQTLACVHDRNVPYIFAVHARKFWSVKL
jgi:hypothetical protein